ncbi:MAG TPA: ABC transporter permease [Ktedonobacteraceae bacterium]|nr:ABC transporter permease [Ktedonobacteraceae bacterium]
MAELFPSQQQQQQQPIGQVEFTQLGAKSFGERLGDGLKAVWHALTINSKVAAGSVIVLIFLLVAVFGPVFVPASANAISHNGSLSPSSAHWLGTTSLGQDIFGQLILGTQTSVLWGFFSGLLVTVLSIVIGLVGGYFGGVVDEILSFVTNVFLVLPGIPLMLVLASYVPPGSLTIALVVAGTSWAFGARMLRAQTLSMRSREFVTAARSNGESTARVIFYEIFPNQLSLVAANFVSTMIQVILAFATLQFLNLGDSLQASWGGMLYWANSQNALLAGQWWWFVPPGACIAVLGAGLSLINFGIDEVADPRLRSEPKIKVPKIKKAVA